MLITAGANVNVSVAGGQTALMIAAQHSRREVCFDMLLTAVVESNGNPNTNDDEGKTAWDYLQENRALIDTATYWRLNDLRYEQAER